MATFSAVRLVCGKVPSDYNVESENRTGGKVRSKKWIFLAGIVLFSSLAVAQNSPQVTGVDPALGKVNDTVTVNGSNVGKESVSAVYLSDDKNDYKSTIVEQTSDKITMKVPQVKAGSYNISLQVGDKLFIKPVKFKVEE
ncbi:MAG TPA: IPT/TIG domain-containing protein [Candidatus Saccharimonadales bacterium]|jgi:hypothetical protein|nr:IPT/TIG domain-containing protein [Candidatus Saccharimonadales bacterium]